MGAHSSGSMPQAWSMPRLTSAHPSAKTLAFVGGEAVEAYTAWRHSGHGPPRAGDRVRRLARQLLEPLVRVSAAAPGDRRLPDSRRARREPRTAAAPRHECRPAFGRRRSCCPTRPAGGAPTCLVCPAALGWSASCLTIGRRGHVSRMISSVFGYRSHPADFTRLTTPGRIVRRGPVRHGLLSTRLRSASARPRLVGKAFDLPNQFIGFPLRQDPLPPQPGGVSMR